MVGKDRFVDTVDHQYQALYRGICDRIKSTKEEYNIPTGGIVTNNNHDKNNNGNSTTQANHEMELHHHDQNTHNNDGKLDISNNNLLTPLLPAGKERNQYQSQSQSLSTMRKDTEYMYNESGNRPFADVVLPEIVISEHVSFPQGKCINELSSHGGVKCTSCSSNINWILTVQDVYTFESTVVNQSPTSRSNEMNDISYQRHEVVEGSGTTGRAKDWSNVNTRHCNVEVEVTLSSSGRLFGTTKNTVMKHKKREFTVSEVDCDHRGMR